MTDLLALVSELVGIPSVSHEEGVLADRVEADLRAVGHLEVERVGDTVVARTQLGRPRRVVLAGHLDTVPPFDDRPPRVDGDTVWGLGAVDMKGGLAVMLDVAVTVADPAVDVTYVLYACEEVEQRHNALGQLAADAPRAARRRRGRAGRAHGRRGGGGVPGHHAGHGVDGRSACPHVAPVDGGQRPAPAGTGPRPAGRLRAPARDHRRV